MNWHRESVVLWMKACTTLRMIIHQRYNIPKCIRQRKSESNLYTQTHTPRVWPNFVCLINHFISCVEPHEAMKKKNQLSCHRLPIRAHTYRHVKCWQIIIIDLSPYGNNHACARLELIKKHYWTQDTTTWQRIIIIFFSSHAL